MEFKRRITKIFVLLIVISTQIHFSFASTKSDMEKLNQNVQSEAAVIIEETTGKVIYDKNANEKKYPASTTKILTAIIAIEQCNLDETATASEYAVSSIPYGYSVANIQIGETLSVKDLLYVMMLQSANEAAIVLAEHISGSVDNFADLMNEKAKEIGCKNTHFVNPNGVHDENHYSTAYDMALIAKYCMQNETFRKIVATTSYTLPTTSRYEDTDRAFANTNDLIRKNSNDREDNYYYQYATGIKTGYTSQAKNCLVSSAEKNGMKFITVVLGASVNPDGLSQRYLDTISMFEFAFDNYSFQKIKEKGNFIDTVEISNASSDTKNMEMAINSDIIALMNTDIKIDDIEAEISLNDNLQAPIESGTKVGKITYKIDGLTYEADLVAKSDVKKKNYIGVIIYIILAIAIIIFFAIRYYISKKKRLKKMNYNINF